MPAKKKSFNFNERYQELEKLVAWFEAEEVDLEVGVVKLEQGAKLVRELKEYLETVENKIKELK